LIALLIAGEPSWAQTAGDAGPSLDDLQRQLDQAKAAAKTAAAKAAARRAKAAREAAEKEANRVAEEERADAEAKAEAARAEMAILFPPSEPGIASLVADNQSVSLIRSSEAFHSWPKPTRDGVTPFIVHISYKDFTRSYYNNWRDQTSLGCIDVTRGIDTIPGSIVTRFVTKNNYKFNVNDPDGLDSNCNDGDATPDSKNYLMFGGLVPLPAVDERATTNIHITAIDGTLFPPKIGNAMTISWRVDSNNNYPAGTYYHSETQVRCEVIDSTAKPSRIVKDDVDQFEARCNYTNSGTLKAGASGDEYKISSDYAISTPFLLKSGVFGNLVVEENANASCPPRVGNGQFGLCTVSAPVIGTPLVVQDWGNGHKETVLWRAFTTESESNP
jgi:hypothetical protein